MAGAAADLTASRNPGAELRSSRTALANSEARVLQDGRASDERWHLRKNGERFRASGEMLPLFDDDDRHLGFVKILRDRTREHHLS